MGFTVGRRVQHHSIDSMSAGHISQGFSVRKGAAIDHSAITISREIASPRRTCAPSKFRGTVCCSKALDFSVTGRRICCLLRLCAIVWRSRKYRFLAVSIPYLAVRACGHRGSKSSRGAHRGWDMVGVSPIRHHLTRTRAPGRLRLRRRRRCGR